MISAAFKMLDRISNDLGGNWLAKRSERISNQPDSPPVLRLLRFLRETPPVFVPPNASRPAASLSCLQEFIFRYAARVMSESFPLSIVVPIYNEEAVLPVLFAELDRVRDGILRPHGPVEIVRIQVMIAS